jgi:hypothetical protein
MFTRKSLVNLMVFGSCICSQTILTSPADAGQKGKDRIAVIKVTYEGFDSTQQELVVWALQNVLTKEAGKRLITEETAKTKLLALGISMDALRAPQYYRQAREALRIRHVLVINLEQLGNFAHGIFRLFTVERPEPYEYVVGTTVDSLPNEIQKAIHELFKHIPPKINSLPSIIAFCGVSVTLVKIALCLRNPQPTIGDLPVPPKPKKP